ncbi:MAG: tRNA 4-thiouridine(8) synthase ThiI [candidate division WOR-3 bacterium]|uniref:tRNA 4-thiouridine(8) synthase ThiI n=2 Tax=candidate division WOR-3 bacterium TaxID=2052148 RepID=A0A7C1SF38_UNCW3|nr:tRNA 4-thiouridine(8) synthase ThiI [candidate division WOR-3 bacterium]
MINSRNSKAVGLFAGSLDSILAFRLIAEQGIAAVALHFRLPFAIPGRTPTDDQLQSQAKMLGVSLVTFDAGADYLEIVRNPQHGYTVKMAPCIDCMAYMLKQAKLLMQEIRADFVFTGEVLGQRPFSQSKRSLKLLEKLTGLEGRILRPLSAKLLEPTIPELSGLIRRERLLDFHGRNRRRQIRLAREFGIVDYPIPGGGCLLTDTNFATRCRDAIDRNEFQTLTDIRLLNYGRHFRLPGKSKLIVGRNEEENRILENLTDSDQLILKPVETVGPVCILRGAKPTKKEIELAAQICARYCDHPGEQLVKVAANGKIYKARPCAEEELIQWRIGGPITRPSPVLELDRKGKNHDRRNSAAD